MPLNTKEARGKFTPREVLERGVNEKAPERNAPFFEGVIGAVRKAAEIVRKEVVIFSQENTPKEVEQKQEENSRKE